MDSIQKQVDKSMVGTPMEPAYKKMDPLRKYNIVLCIIHIIIAIFLIFYFNSIRNPDKPVSGLNLDLYTHNFTFDSTTNLFEVYSKKALSVGELGIEGLIISFFIVTAGVHLIYALNPGNIYSDAIKNGNNWLRWLEYSISATMMLVIIALLSGVKDLYNYFILITSAFAIMWTGQWFETTNKAKWLPILVGFILLLGAFSIIFKSFNDRIKEANDAGFKIPSWIYATVIILFIFYASFGFVPIAQLIFKGDYRKYEYTYLTLSLVSKVSLGVLVAVGFGQRSTSSNPS